MGEPHRSRKSGFFIHLYEEELKILEEKAAAAKMSRTEYLRTVLLFGSARRKTAFSREDADRLHYELNRIGNNINQIAYQANSKRSVGQQEFSQLQDEFHSILSLFEKFVVE